MNSGGEFGAPRGRTGGIHGVRGASGGVPARGPGFSLIYGPPARPSPPVFTLRKHSTLHSRHLSARPKSAAVRGGLIRRGRGCGSGGEPGGRRSGRGGRGGGLRGPRWCSEPARAGSRRGRGTAAAGAGGAGGPHRPQRVTLRRTSRGARWVVGRTVARAGGMAGTPRGQAGWAGRSWSGCAGCGTPSSCRTLANPETQSSLPRTGASARAPSLYPSPPLPARSVARTPAVPPPQPPSGSGRGPAAAEIQSAGAGAAPERGRTLTPGARRRPPQVL